MSGLSGVHRAVTTDGANSTGSATCTASSPPNGLRACGVGTRATNTWRRTRGSWQSRRASSRRSPRCSIPSARASGGRRPCRGRDRATWSRSSDRGYGACRRPRAAKHAGAGFVMLTGRGDRDAERLALGNAFGADLAIDSDRDDPVAALRSATGRRADVVVDVTANAPGRVRPGHRSGDGRGNGRDRRARAVRPAHPGSNPMRSWPRSFGFSAPGRRHRGVSGGLRPAGRRTIPVRRAAAHRGRIRQCGAVAPGHERRGRRDPAVHGVFVP